jgi:DNA-binding MarR family transcriptional regulator
MSRDDFAEIDPDSVAYLGRELSARTVMFHEAIAQSIGLSASEHKCLDILSRAGGPVTAGQLAELTGLTTGAITGIVDRLEVAGYVRRERLQSDRRKVLIHPQPILQEEFLSAFYELGQAVQDAVAHYDRQQLDVIRDFLLRMIQVMTEQTTRLQKTASPR